MMRVFLMICLLISCKVEKQKPDSSATETIHHTDSRVRLQISSRVDTSDSNVNAILELYENYINSRPDSIYNNPYWNSAEKAVYKDFDFSRINMYNGISSGQLFRAYSPFVLSVEGINDMYQIRVLYSNTATEPEYIGSKVWCIHMLSAIKEGSAWKLENLILEETKDWIRRKVGFVEYVYPREHQFNVGKANEAKSFCEKIIKRFNPNYRETFQFYMSDGVDGMGRLENFDYIFSGVTTGKAREGMILSGKGNEHYPHEFIHKLLPKNVHRGHVIEEGLATFLGTKEDLFEYKTMMRKLAKDYAKRDTVTLQNILNNQVEWNGYPVAYPAGALICEVVHELKGDDGILQLALGKTNGYDEIMLLAKSIICRDECDLTLLIENKLRTFE